MKRVSIIAILTAVAAACGGAPNSGVVNCDAAGDTPTAAYKRLYNAVKSKNTESIKAEMTRTTIDFAAGVSAKNKTPIEKVFENGFTGSTFSPNVPDIRDERIDCNMGQVEVWNAQNQVWDDLPFMIEDGQWKLAVGDLFKGTFKSPGKGMAIREAEAANAARGNVAAPVNAANNNKPLVIRGPTNSVNSDRETQKR